MLPSIHGDFVAVSDPQINFNSDGKPWAKVRAVSKERRRTQEGTWEDGETCFIDIITYGGPANNLVESISKGDPFVVTGRLIMREWETNEGRKMTAYSIRAEDIGTSIRFAPARTHRTQESMRTQAAAFIPDITEAPF